MLTDIVGSTRTCESDEAAAGAAVARHDELLDEVITRHGGMRPLEQDPLTDQLTRQLEEPGRPAHRHAAATDAVDLTDTSGAKTSIIVSMSSPANSS